MGAINPSETEVWTQIRKAVALSEWWEDACITDGTNGSDLLNAFQTNLETNFSNDIMSKVKAVRSSLISISTIVNTMIPLYYKELARAMNITETNEEEMLEQIATYMHNNSQSINSRDFTRGAFSASAGNTGDMTIVRHNTDYLGYPIETGRKAHPITAEVIRDYSQGVTYGNDEIEVRSSTKAPMDALDVTSVGETTKTITNSLYGKDGGLNQLRNPDFKSFNSTSGEFDSWYHTTAANISQETSFGFRANQGTITTAAPSGTFSCAKFSGNAKLSQIIQMDSVREPYLAVLRYKYSNGGDTADIIMKTGANTVTVASASDTNWHTLTLVSYYSDAVATPLTFEIEIANYSAGPIYIDDVHFVKMPFIENSYLNFIAGETAAVARREKGGGNPYEGDTWTATDTATDAGLIQKRTIEAFPNYSISLPSNNAGAETIPDP